MASARVKRTTVHFRAMALSFFFCTIRPAILMLIADSVVTDGDNADCFDGNADGVDDNADCVDGNANLLTMACRSSSLSSLGSLSVQVQSSTTYCASISMTTLHSTSSFSHAHQTQN